MTTFTLQDLNLPATADQAVETLTKEKWMEYGMKHGNEETLINMGKALANHELAHQQAQQARLDAVPPQPTLTDIVNNICTQLQLLSTIISQSKAQPEGGENSLQECVATTLQQADWFKDIVKDEVAECVEKDVENYFHHGFDPTDYFDFNDAVCSEVSDQIDDVVSDRLDDVVRECLDEGCLVQEQLEEIVAEKLKSAIVSISF